MSLTLQHGRPENMTERLKKEQKVCSYPFEKDAAEKWKAGSKTCLFSKGLHAVV